MNIKFNNQLYQIPDNEYDRFAHLTQKIIFAQKNGWSEMFNGYTILLNSEFKKYKHNK
mgnify:CR=1 FL=1